MGLDSIPANYPCETQGTAVLVDKKIDCDATGDAGGCPWKNNVPTTEGAVTGMFGTYCWYRGKVGNWYLEILEDAGYTAPYSLYGSEREDGPALTSDECLELHEWLKDHGETYAELVHRKFVDAETAKDYLTGYRYMTWYIGWAGRVCGGLNAWY